ncbi:flagellar basal body L-ring protein FlgH [Endozoicomonadaceae bacterium StTr2]
MRFGSGVFVIVLVSLLAGCSSMETKPKPGDEAWQPPQLPAVTEAPIMHGSLFQQGRTASLFEDRMAYRTGDILTIKLEERTSSSKSAGTDFNKNNDLDLSDMTIFGRTMASVFGSGYSLAQKGTGKRTFEGSSSSRQGNQLSGSITVTVMEVMPNGTLQVAGEKWIKLNQGDEYIRIAGMLRPEDITPDNVVSSQRLANSRIAYSGTGTLANASEAGWLTKFFNSPWFPM